MAEKQPDQALTPRLDDLAAKLDTVAGAVLTIANRQSELLDHVSEIEARRSHDALEISQRLEALERQALGRPPSAAPGDDATSSVAGDLRLALEVLAQVAEGIERLDARTAERLTALRDAAAGPVRDLQDVLAARYEQQDEQAADLAASLQALAARPAAPSGHDDSAVLARIDELGGRVTLHTDTALAGTLRLIDDRLATLRNAVVEAARGDEDKGGFEAGAVMGATQAAWNRLEQRLDAEFDDLGRQLEAMATLLEQAAQSAEEAAQNAGEAASYRPIVSGDQLRKAAGALRDTVVSAGRSRRERRGGPRSLGPGSTPP
jgi:hypothetical protein